MNPIVEEYLVKKAEEKKKKKEKFLINEGLYDYEKNGDYDIKTPINVTDEEYEAIKAAADSVKNERSSDTTGIAKLLYVIGIAIYNIGLFAGIFGAQVPDGYHGTEFSPLLAFTYWSVAFISGSLFLGLANIIELLNDIKNK